MSSRLWHLTIAMPGAAVITIALFWLMITLISHGLPAITDEIKSLKVDFTRVDRDETVRLKDRTLPERPDALDQPPPPPPSSIDVDVPTGTGGVPLSAPKIKSDINPNLSGFAMPDSSAAIPLVRVPPMYPQRALMRGLEGWVRLKFDISPTGAVENPEVVEAEPPIIFNQAAKAAIKKWKYKPRIVDGRPVGQTDVEVVISFHLNPEES